LETLILQVQAVSRKSARCNRQRLSVDNHIIRS